MYINRDAARALTASSVPTMARCAANNAGIAMRQADQIISDVKCKALSQGMTALSKGGPLPSNRERGLRPVHQRPSGGPGSAVIAPLLETLINVSRPLPATLASPPDHARGRRAELAQAIAPSRAHAPAIMAAPVRSAEGFTMAALSWPGP
jgi:hypothetical protein